MVHTHSPVGATDESLSLPGLSVSLSRDTSTFALITDQHLRIRRACSSLARLSGYARRDLSRVHLGYLIAESHRHALLRTGTLALIDGKQHSTLVMGTVAGVCLAMEAEVQSITWKGERCLLWLLQPMGGTRHAGKA